jgi:hypothetical protein
MGSWGLQALLSIADAADMSIPHLLALVGLVSTPEFRRLSLSETQLSAALANMKKRKV